MFVGRDKVSAQPGLEHELSALLKAPPSPLDPETAHEGRQIAPPRPRALSPKPQYSNRYTDTDTDVDVDIDIGIDIEKE